MTQPSEMEIAKAIVEKYATAPHHQNSQGLIDGIARALHDAAKVKPGCVRTEDGVERRFDTRRFDPNNTEREVGLPILADGSIWWQNEELWVWTYGGDEECGTEYKTLEMFYPDLSHYPEWTAIGWVVRWGEGEIALGKCFATEEAAQRAKEQHEQD